jgi:phage N-6-adenine-methyltransferase
MTPELFTQPRTGAAMNRGGSKQDYETLDDFIDAVMKRFGPIDWGLAARVDNAKAMRHITPEKDSLKTDWCHFAGVLWLNPPFDNITPWAKKCADSIGVARRILLLTPASIGANWFRDHVHGKALVLALNGRLTFKGTDAPYPKDCILSVFGLAPGFDVWSWRK